MAGLYPSLHDKFRSENICPICLMEMVGTPKYSCENHHTLCHRCKPYYYSCPTCRSPLTVENPTAELQGPYHMPPPIHFMPHPYPPYSPSSEPSAPFLDYERQPWGPPPPTEDQELYACQYSHLGCYAQIPEHLRHIHEARCQFRPNLEEEHLPTDLSVDEGALENCKYHIVGCNVRLPSWRKLVHEKLCIYKDKLEELGGMQDQLESLNFDDDCGDPEELVECKFTKYGCMVRMPRRRKHTHQEKCNYRKYHDEDDEASYVYVPQPEEDPDEQMPCRWSEFGCQIEPRRCRKETHEEKCNYRREPCTYADYGCCEMVEPARRFAHERTCEYA